MKFLNRAVSRAKQYANDTTDAWVIRAAKYAGELMQELVSMNNRGKI